MSSTLSIGGFSEMQQKFQFSISMIFGITSIVALLLTRHSFWAFVALSEIIVVFVGIECLARNLPTAIRRTMESNCRDRKGDRSPRRESVERNSVRKLRWDIFNIFLVILVPTNLIIWFYSVGGFQWVGEWNVLTVNHSAGISAAASARDHSSIRTVIFVVAAVVWFAGAFLVFKSAYFTLLRRLSETVYRRARRQQSRDWEADLAEVPPQKPAPMQ